MVRRPQRRGRGAEQFTRRHGGRHAGRGPTAIRDNACHQAWNGGEECFGSAGWLLCRGHRDPDAAAAALDALIRKSGDDLRVAETLRRNGPEVLGELRGREGWLAREATK